jgi:hypothetical protein
MQLEAIFSLVSNSPYGYYNSILSGSLLHCREFKYLLSSYIFCVVRKGSIMITYNFRQFCGTTNYTMHEIQPKYGTCGTNFWYLDKK